MLVLVGESKAQNIIMWKTVEENYERIKKKKSFETNIKLIFDLLFYFFKKKNSDVWHVCNRTAYISAFVN